MAATVGVAAYLGRPAPLEDPPHKQIAGLDVLKDLDVDRIRKTVRTLCTADSRVTGYPGNERAFHFIRDELTRLGVDAVEIQEFDVAVPKVGEAELRADTPEGSLSIPLHPLWPNLARTSMTGPAGLAGPLVEIGKGTEPELQGKRLADAIVVMDWDADVEWLSVPEFGGKAVLFRATAPADVALARKKFLTVPADIPRFYVDAGDLPALDALLVRANPEATITCTMAWERATARNILARVSDGAPGRAASDEATAPIIFHAYYDSISVVPTLSPGATQACGAATLLELVRFFKHRRTERPVYALFTGAHGQSMAGMTHFVRRLKNGIASDWAGAAPASLLAQMGRPGLFVGLDLSTRSDQFGVFCVGLFRGQWGGALRAKFKTLGQKLAAFDQSAHVGSDNVRPAFIDGINLTLGRSWWSYFPYRAGFESETPTAAGFPGVTFATVNDDRRRVDTPDDRPEHVRFDLFRRQIAAQPGRTVGLAMLAEALTLWTGRFVSSDLPDAWGRLSGRVTWLDQEKNYTPDEPLVNATVFLKANRNDKRLAGTRGIPVALTADDGSFEFDGLILSTASWGFRNSSVEAYATADGPFLERNEPAAGQFIKALSEGGADDTRIERDGSILYAVDMARAGEYPWTASLQRQEESLNLVCFPCSSFTLLGLTDPRGYIPLTGLDILDAGMRAPPFQFGKSVSDSLRTNATGGAVTLWADPSIRVLLSFNVGWREKRLILINNTEEVPEGRGFALRELRTVPSMVLRGAQDMWTLTESRLRKLTANGVRNPRIRDTHETALRHIKRAGAAFDKADYRAYRVESEKGWALESKAYSETLVTINDMIRGVLFYLALLLPFSYCLERLLIASGTIQRRLWWMIFIFAASFALLAVVHPAFRFTLTPLVVLLAFVILALAGTVSLLIGGKVDTALKEQRQAVAGVHEDTTNVGNIAVRAIDLGIANIRRRPVRGVLTGATIVLVTFILLSFTSLVPVTSISKLRHPDGVPAYQGLLARDRGWSSLPAPLYGSFRRNYRDGDASAPAGRGPVLAGRAWFLSEDQSRPSHIDLAPAAAGAAPGRAYTAAALLCMEPSEPGVTGVDRALLAGRWFRDGEEAAIILPHHAARLLGFGLGDIGKKVRVFGRDLELVGIVDGKKFDAIRDLDGEPLTPVDFVMHQQRLAERGVQEEETDTLAQYVHYPSDRIAIVPFRLGRRLGATVRSVAVRATGTMKPTEEAEGYARRSNLTILACDGDTVTLCAALNASQLKAAGEILIPLVLGFVMVLGTMLGSVYERRNEIFVYNSVGLSPTSVSSLFLAESAVYAVIGAGLGYLLGQSVSKVLLETGALSGLSLNYSAGTAVFVTVLTMFIVLVSAVYPARQAFVAAIPESREDDGAAEEDFEADRIRMFLPFVATPGTVLGMQAYVHEFLDSIQGMTVGQLAVDDVEALMEHEAGKPAPSLRFRAWLAPFDLGVSHHASLRIVFREDRGVFQYHLTMTRLSGDQQNWRRLTPRFLLTLRKQLLMWRVLSSESHRDYCVKGERLFQQTEKADANA